MKKPAELPKKFRVVFKHKSEPHAPALLTRFYQQDGRYYALHNIYGTPFTLEDAEKAVSILAPEYPEFALSIEPLRRS